MRKLAAWLCAALILPLTLTPTSASADGDFPIVGRILATYIAAGGEAVLGAPSGPEVKVTIAGVNGYSQRFERGVVLWNRLGGGWATTPAHPDPKLAKVSNERDALAAAGLRQGVVFRSAAVKGANVSDRLHLAGLLRGGSLIALNGDSDPAIPGVTRVRLSMTSTTNPATFVTKASDRAVLAKALTVIANEDGPVWVHCTLGRDRTGWLVSVLLMVGGVDLGTIKAEYLRSSGAKSSNFDKGVTAMYDRYDGVEGYLLDGLGLSQATYDLLAAKLAA